MDSVRPLAQYAQMIQSAKGQWFFEGALRFSALVAIATLLLQGCSKPLERGVSVGRQHVVFEDTDRLNWRGNGLRPLSTTLWYPAEADSDESLWSIGSFRFGYSAVNADWLSSKRRPLILLSHGTGGAASQLSWLAEALVQQGYLVAGVNHHGNTAAETQSFPGGFVLPGERVRDLTVLLDLLLADPKLGTRIDPARIGVAGFSLGGFTALNFAGVHLPFERQAKICKSHPDARYCSLPPEAGFTLEEVYSHAEQNQVFRAAARRSTEPVSDARVRAVFAMAPALLTLVNAMAIEPTDTPVHVLLAEMDDQVPAVGTDLVVSKLLPHSRVERLAGAGHYSFLAYCNWRGRLTLPQLCRDPGNSHRKQLHQQTSAIAARFFERAFKD